jgi:SAM-dependent methyltransferase
MSARYDGHAEWYDRTFVEYGELEREGSSSAHLADLLGAGEGWCLDVACGTGLHFGAVASTGRRMVGVDLSSDQLTVARRRSDRVLRSDAAALPFRSECFPAVVCTYLHTDIEDMRPVFQEVFRVLRPGGRFVYLGVHPCFRGRFVDVSSPDRRIVEPGYWETGWRDRKVGRASEMRRRVGARHVTLTELIGALLVSRLRLVRVEEGDRREPFASRLGLVAVRDAVETRP